MSLSTNSTQQTGDAAKLRLVSLSKAFGSILAVDNIDLDLAEGQLLALLGPSGCGKTTTLRMVAGLERPSSGQIVLDGKVLANAEMSIEPEKRKLGMVFQTYALWPHMNVFENVAYGLRRARYRNADIHERVKEVLDIVGMSGYGERPATNLSGGQQQRVAVARALATRPNVLLFDEPLSNLDAVLRETMRFEIRSLQQRLNITAIYVTHSQEEALAIADVVGVMNAGRLQQMAPPQELYTRPRTKFVASFVGLSNTIQAKVEEIDAREMKLVFAGGFSCAVERHPGIADDHLSAGSITDVAIRPENIEFARGSDAPATELLVPGTIAATTFSGNLIDYFVETGHFGGRLRVQTMPPAQASVGEEVNLVISARNLVILDE